MSAAFGTATSALPADSASYTLPAPAWLITRSAAPMRSASDGANSNQDTRRPPAATPARPGASGGSSRCGR